MIDETTAEEPDVSAASAPTDPGSEQSKTSQESEKPQGEDSSQQADAKHKANEVECALDNVIEKFKSAQNSSDEKFYELEEK